MITDGQRELNVCHQVPNVTLAGDVVYRAGAELPLPVFHLDADRVVLSKAPALRVGVCGCFHLMRHRTSYFRTETRDLGRDYFLCVCMCSFAITNYTLS